MKERENQIQDPQKIIKISSLKHSFFYLFLPFFKKSESKKKTIRMQLVTP